MNIQSVAPENSTNTKTEKLLRKLHFWVKFWSLAGIIELTGLTHGDALYIFIPVAAIFLAERVMREYGWLAPIQR